MKKFLILGLIFFSLFSISSCDKGKNEKESKETFDINVVNWNHYCTVKSYFLGVKDKKITATCWFYVDSNYEISKDIAVEVKVTYDAFYYTNLLGGDETHTSITYYFYGIVSDDMEELTPRYLSTYEGTKEYFSRGEPEVSIVRISGQICK